MAKKNVLKKSGQVEKEYDPKYLKPRLCEDCEYVWPKDIEDFHGADWYLLFCRSFGVGTSPIVNGKIAIYYTDYLRFSKNILEGTITYWD